MTDDTEEEKQLRLAADRLEKRNQALGLRHDEFSHWIQHNAETGEYTELTKKFKETGTIREYVRLRREQPDVLIEIASSWSLEWIMANENALQKHGIETEIMVGTLDADLTCISEVSLRLLERIIEREDKAESGETHLQSRGESIGDSLVNYLIAMMLDALDWNNQLLIPRDLIVLIKHTLKADTSSENKAMEVNQKRQSAIWTAAHMRNNGADGTIRQVAKILNVSPSTVSRWFPDGNFDDEVEKIRCFLDSGIPEEVRAIAKDLRSKKK